MKEGKALCTAIDRIQDDVVGIAKRIYDSPELAYEEHFAVREQINSCLAMVLLLMWV